MADESKREMTKEEVNESIGKTKVAAVYRLIFMMIALLNQFFVLFGLYPINVADNDAVKMISLGLCIVTGGAAYWKNNSWSPEAKAADKVKDSMKHNDISITDVLEILADVSRNQEKRSNNGLQDLDHS